jgi:hypothetical protein
MAEPQSRPGEEQVGATAPPTAAAPVAPETPPPLQEAFLNSTLEPTDDTPTIISHNPQVPLRPEEALAGVLRGRQLAHFELLEPIGVGGMAAVIRARDKQLDRTVALKILPPDMASDPENVRRFHQEARAAAKLDHENIARVFFCGEDQGLHFIAFELVEGENLRIVLEQRGRIPVPEAIGYMLQIATGLAHASARGVVHRDIKPSNIIISPNGRAKLVDMGLARSLETHSDGGLTQSGVTLGTFDYISPEQALEPREADVRSDIYSLGCTFYHMLTGQAPVPEGTAARKLHHHQNIDPLDPRQLNPEIPDEVAYLLARMMAKEPGDRYQRPEQLVQHLILLAQRLGSAAAMPESVLLANAALPGPPRKQPIFMALAAVAALVALVFVLGPGTGLPPSRNQAQPPDQAMTPLPAEPPRVAPGETGPPAEGHVLPTPLPKAETPTFHVKDAKALEAILRDRPAARVVLEGNLDLTREDALVFAGRELTLESAKQEPSDWPVIKLEYDANPFDKPWAALTIAGGKVKIKNIRFVIHAHFGDVQMAALVLLGGQLAVEQCTFSQMQTANTPRSSISSILIRRPPLAGDWPALTVTECFFLQGEHALGFAQPATVKIAQSAFGPHGGAMFDLQPECSSEATSLQLHNCSAFVAGSAVFRLTDVAACQLLAADNCLFSGLENNASTPTALIEQIGKQSGVLPWNGEHNVFHNCKALWRRVMDGEPVDVLTDLAAFRKRFEDVKSVELTAYPWESAEPLAFLDRQPKLAFRVNLNLPELRQRDGSRAIGVEKCVWGESYDGKLLPIEEEKPADAIVRKNDKIVDPKLTQPGPNRFASLNRAVEAARPGDIVYVMHNGFLKVETVRLEKAEIEVTIRPYPNYHPILTLGETTELEAALFRLHDGQLKLEQLEFRLSPDRAGFKAQTVVALMGDGQCELKNCVATLDGTRDVPLSLLTLADSSAVMRMNPAAMASQIARISITNSFVRGTGQVLVVPASRPFEFRLEESLAALDGSLITIDGNRKDPNTKSHTGITLQKSTTYLTEHLVLLRAAREEGRPNKGLVTTQVNSAKDCLFVSVLGKSLVHLEGMDGDEQMKRLLYWVESRHNAYSNFKEYLDQESGSSGMMPPVPYRRRQWEEFAHEDTDKFERVVHFHGALAQDAPLARVMAADFRTKAETNLQEYGADVERLPRPAEESSAAVTTPNE